MLVLGLVADLRAVLLAVLVATAATNPDFLLRRGAILAAILLFTALVDLRPKAPEWLAICYALLAAFSASWTVAPELTSIGVKNTLACMVLLVTVRTVIRRRRDIWVFCVGLLVGCLVGLWQLLTENNGARLRVEYDSSASRLGIEGLNYNYLAYSFATGMAVLALLVVLSRGRSRHRAVAIVGILLAGTLYAGAQLNGTRGALVGIAGLVAWWLLARLDPRRAWHLVVTVMVVAYVVVFAGLLDGFLREYAVSSTRETGDFNGRLSMWPRARLEFWDHPFRGLGVDAFSSVNPLGIAAHNALLDIGTGVGALGVALFVGIVWRCLATNAETPPTAYMAVGGFLVVTAPIMLTGFWTESPMFWMALGLFSRVSTLLGHEDGGAELVASEAGLGEGRRQIRLARQSSA